MCIFGPKVGPNIQKVCIHLCIFGPKVQIYTLFVFISIKIHTQIVHVVSGNCKLLRSNCFIQNYSSVICSRVLCPDFEQGEKENISAIFGHGTG